MEATATCKKELLIEIPPDVVARETDSVAREYAKVARIPGFRPGHAPQTLVRRRYKDEIKSDVVQALVPKFFENAIKEQKLEVAGHPLFENLKFEEAQPLTVKAVFEIYPEIELKEYKGLEVEEESPQVTDEDVTKALDDLRERSATFEVVEDRAAQADDYVMARYEGRDASDPKTVLVPWREGMVHLRGPRTVREFSENLSGAKPGETRRFEIAYSGDDPQDALRGKTIRYQVEVQGIKRKVVPPADDEFAKSVSDFSTLDELKGDLREGLEKRREREVKNATRQKLTEKLIESYDFPVPEIMVEARVERKLRSALGQLVRQGIDPRTAQVDWRKIREEMRPEAEKEVRGALVLRKIAEAEGIEVSEEEIDESIREAAEMERETPAVLKSRLTEQGEIDTLKGSRRNQKALEFIYQNAKITQKTGDKAPSAEAEPEAASS